MTAHLRHPPQPETPRRAINHKTHAIMGGATQDTTTTIASSSKNDHGDAVSEEDDDSKKVAYFMPLGGGYHHQYTYAANAISLRLGGATEVSA